MSTKRKNLESWKEELVGKQFGRLTVIDVDQNYDKEGKKKGFKVHCTCACGNFINIPINSLIKGLTKSCGCLIQNSDIRLNKRLSLLEKYKTLYIGKQYGDITVIDIQPYIRKSTGKRNGFKAICICSCGNKVEFVLSQLKNNSVYCSCKKDILLEAYKQEYIGVQFGKLTVTNIKQKYYKTNKDGYCAECLCVCGNIKLVSLTHLLHGDIKTCGCSIRDHNIVHFSKEEKELYDYLCTLNFSVERQILVGDHYFDFKISNFLIEYHGSIYHYTEYKNINNPNSKNPPSNKKDKNYHLILRNIALKNNYNLIQVWDFDWLHKKEFIKTLIKSQIYGTVDYRNYVENNLLNNDYGFNIEGDFVEPKPIWISTGYRTIVNEDYIKGRVLIYNSGFTKIE